MKSFKEFLFEKAPPSPEAEKWINDRKEEFKTKYGEKWEEILYATAWKRFNKK